MKYRNSCLNLKIVVWIINLKLCNYEEVKINVLYKEI
jgi:hypothetical protein